MPPTTKGLTFWKIIRRHVPMKSLSKQRYKSNIPTAPSKSKFPSRSARVQPAEPLPQSIKTESVDVSPKEIPSVKYGFPRSFLHHPKYRFIRRLLLISPGLALLYLHMPYEILTVNGQSMAPFLNLNSADGLSNTDRILVQHWHSSAASSEHRRKQNTEVKEEFVTDFQRGQIVIFPTPHRPEKIAVKRIVGIPGDLIQPLPGYAGGDGAVVVPWNHLWVEGDAGRRTESMDSNWYGPISQNLVLGEVKAVLTSWLKWNWIDWREHSWPAREKGRVEENAIMEAAVDPDAVNYSSGWRNGSIALILEHMRQRPDHVLYAFVNDPKIRQETRRLYNNALYVSDIAKSEQERQLAVELLQEMEEVYGREALVFGIRMKRRARDRGELPNARNSKLGEEPGRDDAASDAEAWLRKQGWELEKNIDGTVKTQSTIS